MEKNMGMDSKDMRAMPAAHADAIERDRFLDGGRYPGQARQYHCGRSGRFTGTDLRGAAGPSANTAVVLMELEASCHGVVMEQLEWQAPQSMSATNPLP